MLSQCALNWDTCAFLRPLSVSLSPKPSRTAFRGTLTFFRIRTLPPSSRGAGWWKYRSEIATGMGRRHISKRRPRELLVGTWRQNELVERTNERLRTCAKKLASLVLSRSGSLIFKSEMPDEFGLVMDGWFHAANTRC